MTAARRVSMAHLMGLVATVVWLTLIGFGFKYAWQYESTAGPQAQAPSDFPLSSAVALDPRLPTVVMFAHPSCPCTRVSVVQLAELATRHPGRAKIYVVIVRPPGLADGLDEAPLAQAAQRVPGAIILRDAGGVEAKRFKAATSGQVLVYSARGDKLFTGGVTVARGHYGPNDGGDAIASVLKHGSSKVRETPVFGCSLLGAEG